jgi:ATP adenylyltransferase
MKQIWAPWRMEYIKKDKSGECIFCNLPKAGDDKNNFILFKGIYCFIIMNIYPYNTGHLMIVPYRHCACITELDTDESMELNELTKRSIQILRKVNTPDGFNVGFNLGKSAGAGYDEHIHNHIVPRWTGDTNFMPVLADIKIHPENLEQSYKKLVPHFKKILL